METLSQKNKNVIALSSTLGLFVMVSSIFIYSEVFKRVRGEIHDGENVTTPVSDRILESLSSLKYKNRLTDVGLSFNPEKNYWTLMGDRKLRANKKVIERIISVLRSLKIQNVLTKEPINLQSYALYNPQSKIELYTQFNEGLTIYFGLYNPINDIMYISTDKSRYIYAIERPKLELEALGFGDFIDSRLFNFQDTALKAITIERKYGTPKIEIKREDDRWSLKGRELNGVVTYLKKISSIKSFMILDSLDEAAKARIDNILKSPYYKITFLTKEDHSFSFSVSGLISKPGDLKIEKRKYHYVWTEDRNYPHLISKDVIKTLFPPLSKLR